MDSHKSCSWTSVLQISVLLVLLLTGTTDSRPAHRRRHKRFRSVSDVLVATSPDCGNLEDSLNLHGDNFNLYMKDLARDLRKMYKKMDAVLQLYANERGIADYIIQHISTTDHQDLPSFKHTGKPDILEGAVFEQLMRSYYFFLLDFISHLQDVKNVESGHPQTGNNIYQKVNDLLYSQEVNTLHSHRCFLRSVLLFKNLITEGELRAHNSQTTQILNVTNYMENAMLTYIHSYQIMYETSTFLRWLEIGYERLALAGPTSTSTR